MFFALGKLHILEWNKSAWAIIDPYMSIWDRFEWDKSEWDRFAWDKSEWDKSEWDKSV